MFPGVIEHVIGVGGNGEFVERVGKDYFQRVNPFRMTVRLLQFKVTMHKQIEDIDEDASLTPFFDLSTAYD